MNKKQKEKKKQKNEESAKNIPRSTKTDLRQGGKGKKMALEGASDKAKRIPRFVLAQANPFHDDAFGAKVPDDSTASSCTAFSRNDILLSTGATNGVGAVFRAGPFPFQVNPTSTGSQTWTWLASKAGGLNVGNQAALASTFAALRPVAFGIQLSTRLSYTAASGIVHVAIIPEMLNGSTWEYPVNTTEMGYAPFHQSFPLAELVENSISVSSKFTDKTAFRYIDPGVTDVATYTNALPSSGWCAIQVWVEGAPASSAVLDVEYICHYEALTPAASASGGVITPSPAAPHSPAVMAAASYLNENLSPISYTKGDSMDHVNWGSIWNAGLAIANGVGKVAELALDFVAFL